MLTLRKFAFLICPLGLLGASAVNSLEGTYEYAGGIYNNKAEAASKEYKLQRRYNDAEYEATFIEPGQDTIVYEQGKYALPNDSTCLEIQTYSREPSKTLNKTMFYKYRISHDTLTFRGTLPNGTTVQEYWKKVSR
ncbi:hypothetical protein [Mucilaginibacter psychrotolerans]|uniref:Lipocalin-like domain-containing protein n=1 Tax=Mucilaginibacter psychrotolerans TaxID=1524096 RepID=A0A4Y8SMK8_9SPHI|nr:hypothetical protein [Mucilaginibacter psychrotolerans]TFF39616.1 hypothetical protein E2R66_04390 [Mucilaginibacter psychrotolerans]